MPQERGYERQVGTSGPVAAPRAGPGAFGAGVGAGMVDIADSLHRADMTARHIERQQRADTEAAAFNATFAKLREEADAAAIDLRNKAAPGGAGHADAMRDWWEKRSAGLTEGITEDRIRRSAQAQLQEYGGRLRSSEYQWQEGRRVGKIVTDQGEMAAVARNRAYRLPDQQAFAQEITIGRQGIEALEGVPADVRDKLIRDFEENVAVGFFTGMIERDPGNVAKVLDSGEFDGILPAEQIDRLRTGAVIQIQRIQSAEKAEAAQALIIKKKELAERRAKLEAGSGTPQDWADLARDYEAVGEGAAAVTARATGQTKMAAQAHLGDTPEELRSQIASLTAKKNTSGLSVKEAATLAGMIDEQGVQQGLLGQPGGALLAHERATQKPIAPLDLNDPASFRVRALQASAAAQRYGRVAAEPILPTELPTFVDLVSGGATQKLQALQIIQGFGDPQVIRAAGAQIAGKDGAFRIASQLPLSVAREVLRGDDALKSGQPVWKEDRARADFSKWYGPVLRWIDGSYRDDVFQAAKSFYAGRAVDGGEQQYNPGRFAEAIETVLGRMSGPNGPTGGIARHSKGIVLVPQGMKPDALLQRFARATAQDYAAASGNHSPRWSNALDRKITRREFAQFLPTAIDGAGHYAFRGPGGRLIEDERGETYVIDIKRLGR